NRRIFQILDFWPTTRRKCVLPLLLHYQAMAGVRTDEATGDLNGRLATEQVEALLARERRLYDTGGDVASELPRLRADIDHETYRRLLPGYVRQYVERAAPLVG